MRNGGAVLDASGGLGGEVRWRSGEAVFAASVEPGAGALLTNDGPWICAFGGALLMMSSGHGLAASVEASQQMSGGPGIAATGAAPQLRNDEPGLGASGGASQLRNGGAGVLHSDDFGRCPLRTDLVGWDGLLVGVTAGVGEAQNGTDVGDDESGGPAAAVLGASCKEGGLRGDGRSLEREEEVRTEEEEVNGLSAALAGQASSGGSGRSAVAVALDTLAAPYRLVAPHRLFAPHRPFVPGRLEAPRMLFAPCRLEAPRMLFVPCRLDAVHMLFAPGRLDAARTLVFLGRPVALGTTVALQKLFAPRMPSALHKPVSL